MRDAKLIEELSSDAWTAMPSDRESVSLLLGNSKGGPLAKG